MAEIQQLNLGDLLSKVEQIKSARQQFSRNEELAPLQLQQARQSVDQGAGQLTDDKLKRTALITKVFLDTIGDPDALPDDQSRDRAWQTGLSNIKLLGADMQGIPQNYSPDAYKFATSLSTKLSDRLAEKNQISAGTIVVKDGKQYFANPVFNPSTGTTSTSLTPVGGEIGGKQTGLTPQQDAALKIQTAGGTVQAQERARLGLTPEIAAAEAEIAGKTESAKGRAQSNRAYIDNGLDAAEGFANIKRSIDLLDKVSTGGIQSEWGLRAKQMFGIEGADEGELSANLGKAILSQLRATFGAQFTEKEGDRLSRIESGFGKNTETNKRLLQSTLTIMERTARRGIAAAKKDGDDFSAAEIERAMQTVLGGGENKQSATRITGDDDYNRLPSGALFLPPDGGPARRKP